MATGDQRDFISRLRAQLPTGWFPSSAPVLTAVLSGISQALADIWSLLQFVASQARLKTATGAWLDAAAFDYLGTSIARNSGESDIAFRARVLAEILVKRNTRAAVMSALETLTGNVPVIFEPRNTADTGGLGTSTFAYNTAGAWGSYSYPFQLFVTAYRPPAGTSFSATDAQIYASIAAVLPAAVVAWVNLQNVGEFGDLLDVNFVLDESKLG